MLFMWSGAVHAGDDVFGYFAVGTPEASIALPVRHPETSLVLMGGGDDVDQAFRWMIRRAGIKPGDQSRYIRFWKGTALDRSLTALLGRNVPIGGTSAGLAILGEYAFAALQGTIDSAAALSNPFDPRITLDPDPAGRGERFLVPKPMTGVLTDSHFDRRKRMGRLIAFLSRLDGGEGHGCLGKLSTMQKHLGGIRGIGVSEQAALLIESTDDRHDYIARRIKNPWSDAEGAVYFVRPLAPPTECEPGMPLSIEQVEIRKLADSRSVFNLTDWSGVDAYTVSIENGHFDTPPY